MPEGGLHIFRMSFDFDGARRSDLGHRIWIETITDLGLGLSHEGYDTLLTAFLSCDCTPDTWDGSSTIDENDDLSATRSDSRLHTTAPLDLSGQEIRHFPFSATVVVDHRRQVGDREGINLRVSQNQPPEREPNNAPRDSDELAPLAQVTGFIGEPAPDQDWFRFSPTETGRWTLRLTSTRLEPRVQVYLTRDDQPVLVAETPRFETPDVGLSTWLSGDETYLVRVSDWRNIVDPSQSWPEDEVVDNSYNIWWADRIQIPVPESLRESGLLSSIIYHSAGHGFGLTVQQRTRVSTRTLEPQPAPLLWFQFFGPSGEGFIAQSMGDTEIILDPAADPYLLFIQLQPPQESGIYTNGIPYEVEVIFTPVD